MPEGYFQNLGLLPARGTCYVSVYEDGPVFIDITFAWKSWGKVSFLEKVPKQALYNAVQKLTNQERLVSEMFVLLRHRRQSKYTKDVLSKFFCVI